MNLLIQLARWEGLFFIFGLAGIVVVQLLTGSINTRYLLCGNQPGSTRKGGKFSPQRLQLLVLTVGAAMFYLSQLLEIHSAHFPDIDQNLVALLGGSNAIYVGGKAYNRWFGSRKVN